VTRLDPRRLRRHHGRRSKNHPCLWFADEAEEAARFYTGIFPNSRITTITRYSDVGSEIHHRTPGSVMVVAFELEAMLRMKKIDIAEMRRAHDGKN
jgi:predicted 3-demethylubiquinone-9 3-methyltransferase (glyoxalase superfamily)